MLYSMVLAFSTRHDCCSC